MAEYNSRLFTAPKLRAIVELTDDISNNCSELSDILSGYEQAEDEEDPAAVREEARETAWSLMSEILFDAKKLEEKMNALAAEGEGE